VKCSEPQADFCLRGYGVDLCRRMDSFVAMSMRIATAEARKRFASIVRRSAHGERIELTRYQDTMAVLIPKKDFDKLQDCEGSPAAATVKKRRPGVRRTNG